MMIQSDFHIFQGGWNHQLDEVVSAQHDEPVYYIYIYITNVYNYIYIEMCVCASPTIPSYMS